MALARRIEETNEWKRGGHRTAAHAIAGATGSSVSEAMRMLQTGERLEELPETADAFRRGRVTPAQVHEIASAAIEAPECELDLLDTAEQRDHATLRDKAARIRNSHRSESERRRRAHEQR